VIGQPFLLGVNYWPPRKAMAWWSSFDAEEVRADFAEIARLGLGLVRIFLLWEDFQPAPGAVSPRALADLRTVCDVAAEAGLSVDVTFFTGHMSGPNWAPGWLLLPDQPLPPGARQVVSGGRVYSCGYRNPFTDPLALDAEELLLRAVVGELHAHPAVALWNLGNEPDLFARPPDAAAGRAWVRRMAGVVRSLGTSAPITCGLHVASLVEDNGLRVPDVFAELDLAAMHAYPMYADWARGPLDVDFVPFTCALTAALCGRPVLMEEFGGCTEAPGRPSGWWEWPCFGAPRRQFMASEEDLAAYVEAVLPRLVDVGATGALLWCYADYGEELADRPPCDESRHERWFGLVRPDGSWKPHARAVQRFAATRPVVRTGVPAGPISSGPGSSSIFGITVRPAGRGRPRLQNDPHPPRRECREESRNLQGGDGTEGAPCRGAVSLPRGPRKHGVEWPVPGRRARPLLYPGAGGDGVRRRALGSGGGTGWPAARRGPVLPALRPLFRDLRRHGGGAPRPCRRHPRGA
jgi:hypothetical protein